MATIKSYSDLQQSKKLAEILPLESADGYWFKGFPAQPYIVYTKGTPNPGEHISCWSLAALLSVYPMVVGRDMDMYCCWQNHKNLHSKHYDNPIDACYEMILKLHELKML